MKLSIQGDWKLTMDRRVNPLRHLDKASQHHVIRWLAWTWSTIASLAFLAIFELQIAWLAHTLLIAGLVTTVIAVKRAEKRSSQKVAALKLSHGSVCVWQMDREA